MGGGTLSTTDFFRRRKKEDFLFTTWRPSLRTDVFGPGTSILEGCLPTLGKSLSWCDRYEASSGVEFFADPNTLRKNPGRSLGGLGSGGGGKMGLLYEMVGLGAGGSSESPNGGGGSSSKSTGLLIVAVPIFSGRCFFFPWSGGDLILFLRDAIGVIEDWGFSVF